MKNYSLFIVSLTFSVFFFSCTPTQTDNKSTKLKVLTTTGMIQEAVQKILKDSADVDVIIPVGADPHSYQTSQEDLTKFQDADIIVVNGFHLEGKMHDLFENLKRTKTIIYMSNGVPASKIRQLDHIGKDPHIWLDVQLWEGCIAYMASKLEKKTNWTGYIKDNLNDYLDQLDKVDADAKKRLEALPKGSKYLITSHDAFGYFGIAYGIKVLGIKGFSTTSEASIKHVDGLVKLITEKKIKTIFPESSTSAKDIKTLVERCQENGVILHLGKELYSDSMGAKNTPTGTYSGMITHNINTIVNELK